MKNLKKYFTFTTIIAIYSFIVLMLFFTPCITLTNRFDSSSTPDHIINLFKATFGCSVANPHSGYENITYAPCAGLILAFIFLILGIILSIAKNRIKWLGFIASGFYIASGVLVACAVPMMINSNYDAYGTAYRFGYYGWTIAVATLICFSGLIAFIDVLASYSKPKVQEVY